MSQQTPRGVAPVRGRHAVDDAAVVDGGTLPPTPLPDTQRDAADYVVRVQVGPHGVQCCALANGIVIARSGWSTDVTAAWSALGYAIAGSLVRVANRAANPARYDA
jgi:hypothetical protein